MTTAARWPTLLGLALALLAAPAAGQQQGGGSKGLLKQMTGGSGSSSGGSGGSSSDMYSEPYYKLDELNAGLPPLDDPPDLETPQSCLRNFFEACRVDDYDRAARSMNLNDLDRLIPRLGEPGDGNDETGPAPLDPEAMAGELARRFNVVLQQKLLVDFSEVPDTPEGENFGYSLQKKLENDRGGPSRKVYLGTIDLDGQDAAIWLQRVKVPGGAPVWVFSRQTVGYVPELYARFGPSRFEKALPDFLRRKVLRVELWQWGGLLVFLAIGLAAGWAAQEVLARALRRSPSNWATALAWSIRGPVAVGVGLLVFDLLAAVILRLSGPVMVFLEPMVFVAVVLAIAWIASRVVDYASARLSDRYEGEERGSESQAMLTRVRVAQHALTVLVVLAGLGIGLWQFEWFRAIGYGLLASAGIAALVLGLAAQRPLGNLFAGVQLAITQPVRVGDAVIFEGNWGWIESIDITYVVIRTWDMRRLVVPTARLMDSSIENWTKGGENMMKPVHVYADYRVDVAAVREAFERILRDTGDWDEEVPPILQVTDCKEETVELRALCSAGDPSTAWNLHCTVRERLIAFLRDLDGGRYLPRTRVAMVDEGRDGGGGKRGRRRDRRGRFRSGSRSRAHANAEEAAEENRMGGRSRGGEDGGDGDGD